MQAELETETTIELGSGSARIAKDPMGRRIVTVKVEDREVSLTINQALIVREILEAALSWMTRGTKQEDDG